MKWSGNFVDISGCLLCESNCGLVRRTHKAVPGATPTDACPVIMSHIFLRTYTVAHGNWTVFVDLGLQKKQSYLIK